MEIEDAYEAAWDEWAASEDSPLWETTITDGLGYVMIGRRRPLPGLAAKPIATRQPPDQRPCRPPP